MQLSNEQTDPTNAFLESERQISETQWAMGNVKSVSKNALLPLFFDENWPKKNSGKKYHNTLLN